MAEQKRTDGSLALRGKPRILTIPAAEAPKDGKLRIAAYCRVSTDSEDQLNSFATQNSYYTALITGNPDWELVDIYADRGITGTSAEKRADFQRLIADCKRGRIDRILVKSISRFARNTKDCLEVTRDLKAIGVSVCFEEQNIDTAMVSGEMMTAIFASLAQKESESNSQNMQWSFQKRMQNGTFIPMTLPFGYRKNSDGKIVINESKAKYVQAIFQDYLSGYNTRDIANKLESQKAFAPALSGRTWTVQAISRILRNEKYIGDSLWQKSYRTETVPRHERKNRGERTQYYAEYTHPAIIEKGIFEKVQFLLTQRKEQFYSSNKEIGGLRGILICGCCGAGFRMYRDGEIVYRICRTHAMDAGKCSTGRLSDTGEQKISNEIGE